MGVDTFSVGLLPVGIAADEPRQRLYVADSGGAIVTRIDLATGQVDSLSLPGSFPEDIALSPDGALLLVTSLETIPVGMGSRSRVYAIDPETFTLTLSTLVDDDPEGIEIASDSDDAWVATDNKIQEIDLRAGIGFLTVGDIVSGVEGVDDFEHPAALFDKSMLFVTNGETDRIDVIDLSLDSVVASVTAGLNPEAVELRPGTAEVHVTNQGDATVTVFSSVSPFTVAGTVTLSQNEPRGLRFTPDGSEAYVVMRGGDSVIVYDPDTLTQSGAPIGVGASPEGIAIMDVTDPVNLGANQWRSYR